MLALAVFALLQTPNELATFLASLEKDRTKGTAASELLGRIEEWSKSTRTPQAQARLAWNREHLMAVVWIDSLRYEWLKKRMGQSVTLGKSTGLVKDVKADRVTLDVQGRTAEIAFHTLGPDEGLAEIKSENLVPTPVHWESILQFAGGKREAAIALARGFPNEGDRAPCLRAFVGWALQSADRLIAEGKAAKAAEFLVAGWTPHEDLVACGDGALGQFVQDSLLPLLLDQAAKAVEKDRKEARRVLDLVPKLTTSEEVLARADALRFPALESNQWHPVRLKDLKFIGNDRQEDGKISWDDPTRGSATSMLDVEEFPHPWNKISGFRARLRPEAEYLDVRVGFGDPAQFYTVAVNLKEGTYFTGVQSRRGAEVKAETAKKLAAKAEYLFRFEGVRGQWKMYIDALEVKSFAVPADPSHFAFSVDEGKCDLLNFEIRRK
jgi:hypothetical protein